MIAAMVDERRQPRVGLQPEHAAGENGVVAAGGHRFGLDLDVHDTVVEKHAPVRAVEAWDVLEPIALVRLAGETPRQCDLRARQHVDAETRRVRERAMSIAFSVHTNQQERRLRGQR